MARKIEIHPGRKFGHLTYIRDAKAKTLPSGQKPRTIRCKCECGSVKNYLLLHVIRGRITHCNKCYKPSKDIQSVIGSKYGYLEVVSDLGTKVIAGRRFRIVKGRCVCGKEKTYRLSDIKNRKSCGCLSSLIISKKITKHGLKDHPLYSHWNNMKNRCANENVESFGYCGAKGVRVCKEWVNDFKCFYDWAISNGWKDGLTLDRHPNTLGNYEPSNCRWATNQQQANNKTNNVKHFYNGEEKTLSEWASIYGFSYKSAHRRINKQNWSIEEVIAEYTPKVKQLLKKTQ